MDIVGWAIGGIGIIVGIIGLLDSRRGRHCWAAITTSERVNSQLEGISARSERAEHRQRRTGKRPASVHQGA